jgi:hypothetical protein
MSEYNLHVIRELLGEAFSSGEITTLAFDLFHDVYQDFTAGMTRSQKIRMVVDHANKNGAMPGLLAYVERQNAYQYGRFAPQLKSQAGSQQTAVVSKKPVVQSSRRLKSEKDQLESQSELLAEKVRRLRDAVAIETDVTRKFQIEQQLKQAKEELSEVDDKIDEIDDLLAKN